MEKDPTLKKYIKLDKKVSLIFPHQISLFYLNYFFLQSFFGLFSIVFKITENSLHIFYFSYAIFIAASCSRYAVSCYRGMKMPRSLKEELWDKYSTVAPARLRRFIEQSKRVKRA